MLILGYAFSKLAMTFCGFVVQVHQVRVTLAGDAAATPVPASTPKSVVATAPSDINFLSFTSLPPWLRFLVCASYERQQRGRRCGQPAHWERSQLSGTDASRP